MLHTCFWILLLLNAGFSIGQDSVYYITPAQSKIEVKVDQPFIVKLRSCSSCGNHWNLTEIDTLNVRLVSVRSENTSGRRNRVGGDVFVFWRFTGRKAGKYKLGFVYTGPAKDYKEISRCEFELYVD